MAPTGPRGYRPVASRQNLRQGRFVASRKAGKTDVLTPVRVLSGADQISTTADDDVAHVS